MVKNKLVDQEDLLQAVIVADSFNTKFQPLSRDKPRCLIPLLNVPMLDYSLEICAVAKVHEVFIVCCWHADKIEEYIKNSKWSATLHSQPKITVLISKELRSMGDVLRELDNKMTSDFILINGDVVSNVDLSSAIEAHKARKEADKNAIMTMVLKQGTQSSKSCSSGDESLFIMNTNTNEIVYYHGLDGRHSKTRFSLDLDVFDKNEELEARIDLLDCRIDICSIEVPALFTENFDYQDIRKDFVRGILESDLLGKTIYAHILTDKYAARVTCPYVYDLVSKDIMGRWTYPIVPDSNWASNTNYEHSLPYTYRDSNVTLTSSTVVSGKSTIGSGSSIGKDSKIKDSVIGNNVTIGANVLLDGAYIMDDCVIGDSCVVKQSIISNNVTLKNNVRIPKGCLLASHVHLDSNSTLEEYSQWYSQDNETLPFNPDSDDEDFDFKRLTIAGERNLASSISEDSENGETTGYTDTDEEIGRNKRFKELEWIREVQQTLERAYKEFHTPEIAGLELNTLKMAMNITFQDLRSVLVPFYCSQIDYSNALGSAKKIFTTWSPLIFRFVHSMEDQKDILHILTNECLKDEAKAKILIVILQCLYENDILEEDAILSWYVKLPDDRHYNIMKEKVYPLIEWFENASEED